MGDTATLHDLVLCRKELDKDKLALIYDTGRDQNYLTYQELWLKAQQTTSLLRSMGVQDEVVGLCVPPSPDAVALLLGILGVPAAYFPFLPEAPESIIHSLQQLGCQHVIMHVDYLELLDSVVLPLGGEICPAPCLASQGLVLLRLGGVAAVSSETRGAGLAYCLATSGTTGTPKLVRVPHHCIVPNILCLSEQFELSRDDMVFNASPLTFDPSAVEIFMTLTSGATLLVVPEEVKRSPRRLLDMLHKRHPVTVLQATPTLLARFPAGSMRRSLLGDDSRLRVLALGGELFPLPQVLQEWCAPGNTTRLFNLYGTTEVSCWASCQEVLSDFWKQQAGTTGSRHLGTQQLQQKGKRQREEEEEEEEEERNCPIGPPLTSTSLQVMDDNGHPVMHGLGELWIGSRERVCLVGEETSSDVRAGEMKWRPTGDIVRAWEDGQITMVGRKDDVVKRHGKRISTAAIEKVALSVEGVEAARTLWEGGRLALFLVSNLQDTVAMETAVAQQMVAHLPSYSRPDLVQAVMELPLTAHGKLDRGRLLGEVRDRMQQTMPKSEEELQAWAAQLWQKHLPGMDRLPEASESFLHLGGDSLQAVQLTAAVEMALGQPLPALLDTVLHGNLAAFTQGLGALVLSQSSSANAEVGNTSGSEAVSDSFVETTLKTLNSTSKVHDSLPVASDYMMKSGTHANVLHGQQSAGYTASESASGRDSAVASTKDGLDSEPCSLELPSPGLSRSTADAEMSPESDSTTKDDLHAPDGSTATEAEEPNVMEMVDVVPAEVELHPQDASPGSAEDVKGSIDNHANTHPCEVECLHDKKYPSIPHRTNGDLETDVDRTILQQQRRKKIKRDSDMTQSAEEVAVHVASAESCTCSVESFVGSVSRGGRVTWCCSLHRDCRAAHSQLKVRGPLALQQAWKYDTGKCVDASPLVLLQRSGRHTVVIGSHSHLLTAVQLSTGAVLWETRLPDRIESSACLSGCGRWICVGCYDGGLYTLSAATGELKWCVNTGDAVKSSPASIPGTSTVVFGSHDGHLYAVDVQAETVLWRHHLGGGSVFSSPLLDCKRDRVVVATLRGTVTCMELKSGRSLWQTSLVKPVFSSPCLHGDQLVVGCVDGMVCCLDLLHGHKVWSFATKAPVFSSAAVFPDLPVSGGQGAGALVIGSHDHNVYCLSSAGSLLWSFATKSPVYSVPFCIGMLGTSQTGQQESEGQRTAGDSSRLRGEENSMSWQQTLEESSSSCLKHRVGEISCLGSGHEDATERCQNGDQSCLAGQRLTCALDCGMQGVHDRNSFGPPGGSQSASPSNSSCLCSCNASPSLCAEPSSGSHQSLNCKDDGRDAHVDGITLSCSNACGDHRCRHSDATKLQCGAQGRCNLAAAAVREQTECFSSTLDLENACTLARGKSLQQTTCAGNTVAVACTSGQVYVLAADCGSLLGSVELPGEVFSSPVLVGDLLLVGCRDNHLYCYQVLPAEIEG